MSAGGGKVILLDEHKRTIAKRQRDRFWAAVSDAAAYARSHVCPLCPREYYKNPDFRSVVCPFAKLLPFCPRKLTD